MNPAASAHGWQLHERAQTNGRERLVRGARLEALPVPARGLEGGARRASGLLHATTGAGKTYAVWFGALQRGALARRRAGAAACACCGSRRCARSPPTPRARWRIGGRAGARLDGRRAHRRHRLGRARAPGPRGCPTALVTTPESLSLLLVARRRASSSRTCDWSSSTNGTSCWAASAACRCSSRWRGCARWRPALLVWGLSATLGNLTERAAALLGPGRGRQGGASSRATSARRSSSTRCCPPTSSAFRGPATSASRCCRARDRRDRAARRDAGVHQRTRSQAEIWYQAHPRGAARLGRRDRAAPRLARRATCATGSSWA